MLIRTTVNPITLLKKGPLYVNPNYDLNTLTDLEQAISAKVNNTSWSYIYLPAALYKSTIDLTEFLVIYHMFYLSLKPYSQIKEAAELNKLRLYYFLEVSDSAFVIDLDYIKDGPVYRANKITVYDEMSAEDDYRYTFDLNLDTENKFHIASIQIDFETRELKQNIVLNYTLKEK